VKKTKVTQFSGNVFRDLGFSLDEAEHLKVRADLMLGLQAEIEARGLKQGEAAKLLGVTQPRVSDLMCGRIDLFSIDTLVPTCSPNLESAQQSFSILPLDVPESHNAPDNPRRLSNAKPTSGSSGS